MRMKNRTDVELITFIQEGNEKAYEELYKRYERKCYYTAFSMVRNEHDAKDAVQATFIQIHKSIHSLRKPEYFVLWMNRITCGKCKDIFRKNKTLSIDIDDEHVINEYVEERINFHPKKNVRYKNDQALIDHFIEQLPYVQREVIVLCYFHSLSMKEIAEIVGEPVGTIKSRLFLAKKALRRHIEAYESRDGVKLDFNSITLDALLTGYFTVGFSNLVNASFLSLSCLGKFKSFCTTTVGKVVVVTAVASTSGVAITQAYQMTHTSKELPHQTLPAPSSVYEDTEMKNARQAYFTLMNWAANKEQIELRAKEAKSIQSVYEYLKKDGGPYWQYLSEKGWASFFEQIL